MREAIPTLIPTLIAALLPGGRNSGTTFHPTRTATLGAMPDHQVPHHG
jgi:hypothetical protein